LFELITKTAIFPGDSEGLQLLEQAAIIGTPTADEIDMLEEVIP